MKLPNVREQHVRDFSFDASGSITSGSAGQLVLPENTSRSSLFLQNTSSAIMWYGFGSGRATCTLSGSGVGSVTVTNAGFGFTRPPIITFYGGGYTPQQGNIPGNTAYIPTAGYGFPSPQNPAQAHAVLTGGKISSIVVDNPGSGYITAPYVAIQNDPLDPNGCFDPSVGSGSGFQLYPGNSIYEAHSVVVTEPIGIFCATTTSTFACRWTP